jgi:DNA-binding transcriptional regulator YhcF (GntR family)
VGLDCRISTGSTVPIYRQLTDQIRLAILLGRVAAGDQLPSVRALALRLVINPNTVARAYGELARDGVIESQQGKGYFVARQRPVYTKAQRRRRLAPLIDALVSETAQVGLSPDELIDLVARKLRELGMDRPSM